MISQLKMKTNSFVGVDNKNMSLILSETLIYMSGSQLIRTLRKLNFFCKPLQNEACLFSNNDLKCVILNGWCIPEGLYHKRLSPSKIQWNKLLQHSPTLSIRVCHKPF